MTRYGDEISEIINSSDRHMTAEQIFFEMKKIEPKIVLASVYNNLNTLTRQGLIRKLSFESEADRYDKLKRHDHLVCSRCGKIGDFDFGNLTETFKSQLGFDVTDYDLKVYYECTECKNKK